MKIILLITLSLILDSCLNNGGTENLPPLSGSYSRHDSAVSYCSKTVNSVHYDTTEAIAFDLDLTFADSNKFSFKHYYNGVKSCEGKGHYTGRTIPSNTPIVITYRTISFDDASYDLTFTFTQFSCASPDTTVDFVSDSASQRFIVRYAQGDSLKLVSESSGSYSEVRWVITRQSTSQVREPTSAPPLCL